MMVGIVAVWRCKCGMRMKALAEADSDKSSTTQVVSCPKCGASKVIHAEKILSVTEVIDLAYSAAR